MQQLKPRTGSMTILVLLLVVTIGSMIALKSCSKSQHSTPYTTTADTINVALLYSPTSFFMDGDSLGGINYDLLHLIATNHNLVFNYTPIATTDDGLSGLHSGRFDIVTAITSVADSLCDTAVSTDAIYTIGDTESCVWVLANSKAALRDSINNWISQLKPTPVYQSLTKRYLNQY